MKKETTYTTDGKCSVYCGKNEIARSYLGRDGYSVHIRQGMPRDETAAKIIRDCPDFAKANNLTENTCVYLF